MRVLAALSGNALVRRDQPAGTERQLQNLERAAAALAGVATGHELVLTHGNGPWVGLLEPQSESCHGVAPHPLDLPGAEGEGMVGHLLELALRNRLPGRDVVTVLTGVVVSPDDPAFARPSEPIGPVYTAAQAQWLAAERGWTIGPDGGPYRRLVPSPEPQAIAELRSLRALVEGGAVVICAAAGGVPVTVDAAGTMRGVEAVIDEDLTAALLARRLDADLLLLLTEVDAVYFGWGTDEQRPLRSATPAQLRRLELASGSIASTVEAACRFVEATGRRAGVGALADAERVVRGEAGTQVLTAGDAEPASV